MKFREKNTVLRQLDFIKYRDTTSSKNGRRIVQYAFTEHIICYAGEANFAIYLIEFEDDKVRYRSGLSGNKKTFQEIYETLSVEVKKKLLWHLDLFK